MSRRILVMIAIVIAIIIVTTQWIFPVYLSIETAHTPPVSAWLVPRDLSDRSVATAPGTKLSYFGYEFEVPWSDLDESKTKSYRDMTLLVFHSGLRLLVGASPPKLWLSGPFGKSAEQGSGAHSDYDLLKTVYGFTPDKMHLWAFSPRIHYRETLLLSLKSATVHAEAATGFFYIGNSVNQGFQEGNPQAWPTDYRPKSRSAVSIQLFSDQGCLNLTLFQRDFANPAGVSQADLNRIIQSVRRVDGSVARKAALPH